MASSDRKRRRPTSSCNPMTPRAFGLIGTHADGLWGKSSRRAAAHSFSQGRSETSRPRFRTRTAAVPVAARKRRVTGRIMVTISDRHSQLPLPLPNVPYPR
jgi:hypothetical protein